MGKIISKILIIVGALLTMIGLLFKLLKWIDIFQGIIYGPLILILGIIILLYKRKQN
jgi:hypothetical protein